MTHKQQPNKPGYNFVGQKSVESAATFRQALEASMYNYFTGQLGLPPSVWRSRVDWELEREWPKSTVEEWGERGWTIEGAQVLDVGAGQGGMLHELLVQGADAYGVEPGQEFQSIAKQRLSLDGFDKKRVIDAAGESLPFDDESFDYLVSLQVLEHVEDPRAVINEMYRVLKPGGRAYISCENYLAFREQHYKLRWLPLLPKRLGGIYLRLRGRDPSFLKNHITYVTYPQIWRLCDRAGFANRTHILSDTTPASCDHKACRGRFARGSIVQRAKRWQTHLKETFSVGVKFYLQKPR